MSGVILWQGKSRIDGAPIVCVMTGIGRASSNPKTGEMLQTWIIRADMHPSEALATGKDVSICGGCPMRPKAYDGHKATGRACYVNIMGVAAVYRTFRAGGYPRVGPKRAAEIVKGKAIRFGAYGDPAAVPVQVWQVLADNAGRYTGYTHQWRNPKLRDVAPYCMASVEQSRDVVRANGLGFGTFRVLHQSADVPDDVLHCPASAERGHAAQCITCGACDGTAGRNVVIHAHSTGARYLPVLS